MKFAQRKQVKINSIWKLLNKNNRILQLRNIYIIIYIPHRSFNLIEIDTLIDVLKPLPIQLPPIRCQCIESCERCENVRTCISFPHVHSSLSEGCITSASYTGLMESLGTLYRPAPLRPVARGKLYRTRFLIFFDSLKIYIRKI